MSLPYTQEQIHVYFVPGLAASIRIFEYIDLPQDRFVCHYLSWHIPSSADQSLSDYIIAFKTQIKHPNPVLVGVSFGGIIVQELARVIDVRKVVIVSSIKRAREYPKRLRLVKALRLYRLFPVHLVASIHEWGRYIPGLNEKKRDLYKKYLSVTNPVYLKWSIRHVVSWEEHNSTDASMVHIQGTKDPVFPHKHLTDYIPVNGGTHAMIIYRYRWFNEHLPSLITAGK